MFTIKVNTGLNGDFYVIRPNSKETFTHSFHKLLANRDKLLLRSVYLISLIREEKERISCVYANKDKLIKIEIERSVPFMFGESSI
jgi:hypothetical protein